jgi:hypothetical protein
MMDSRFSERELRLTTSLSVLLLKMSRVSKARRFLWASLTDGIKITDVKQESNFQYLKGQGAMMKSGHSAEETLRRGTSDEDSVPISGLRENVRGSRRW